MYISTRTSKTQMISIYFSRGIPDYINYIKTILIPEDGINTPHLCFSSTDSRCLNDRQAFATNTVESLQ
jgi:hypothetical protein